MKTVIELGKEADLLTWGFVSNEFEVVPDIEAVERFAALVRADERERFLQAVEEMRPVQNNPLLQNKPPEFWISNFKKVIEARGNT